MEVMDPLMGVTEVMVPALGPPWGDMGHMEDMGVGIVDTEDTIVLGCMVVDMEVWE
jgi:hypothetical protein